MIGSKPSTGIEMQYRNTKEVFDKFPNCNIIQVYIPWSDLACTVWQYAFRKNKFGWIYSKSFNSRRAAIQDVKKKFKNIRKIKLCNCSDMECFTGDL